MVPRWQLIVSEGPKSGALEVELVLKGCGSIHENLKLALLVHLAALGVDWLQCLLTEVWDCDCFEVSERLRKSFRCQRERWQAMKQKMC